jgi:flagellar basal body-associated protein FliL
MTRAHFAIVAAFACAVSAAQAAAPVDPALPSTVSLPPILAPMVVDGRLQGYAYLTIALKPRSRDRLLAIREKVPFLQDAFLRELNRGSFAKADDAAAFDTEAAKARLLASANSVLPAGTVVEVQFETVVMQSLRQQ